ncbi:MAG: hypothetical protein PHI32_02155 [Dysgonamonadaceae bacterium]|nr:hypothetical protein [Dysgonamonadaceae bacterium]MDD4727604.1 hypothetical protein [Dysgonamonadaceae bacterium]
MQQTEKNKQEPNRKLRTKRIDCLVSEEEYELINIYLKKYKITNRSRWFRQLIVGHILKTFEQDYPTLFNENEMRR